MGERELTQELEDLRVKLRRQQTVMALALGIVGLGTLAAVGLVGYLGLGLHERMGGLSDAVASESEEGRRRAKALALDLARQQQELSAIRKATSEDLRAIEQASSRIARLRSTRDPARELQALREANARLWSELAEQRTELLEALKERPPVEFEAAPGASPSRFVLGETVFVDPKDTGPAPSGFEPDDQPVRRASAPPANPGYLVLELEPVSVKLGEPYELVVKLVNRSNRELAPKALRLAWSFAGKNSGGSVPVDTSRVAPDESTVLYAVAGRWTPAHEKGPVVLTATLTLDGGGRLTNSLRW